MYKYICIYNYIYIWSPPTAPRSYIYICKGQITCWVSADPSHGEELLWADDSHPRVDSSGMLAENSMDLSPCYHPFSVMGELYVFFSPERDGSHKFSQPFWTMSN